jgi:hypothetical protein
VSHFNWPLFLMLMILVGPASPLTDGLQDEYTERFLK